jgi:hypothetical protein
MVLNPSCRDEVAFSDLGWRGLVKTLLKIRVPQKAGDSSLAERLLDKGERLHPIKLFLLLVG